MSAQNNIDLVKQAYAAFKRGEQEALFALLDDALDFQHPMPQSIWSFAGRRKGREGFAEFIAGSSQVIEREHFEVDEFIAQGDYVAVVLSERMRAKTTGISFDNPHVHVFKIVGGKIVQFMVFEDTAPIIAALQGYRKVAPGD
jgi:ketosteroid isomerase-like protein